MASGTSTSLINSICKLTLYAQLLALHVNVRLMLRHKVRLSLVR